ncbi:NRDE family protein [Fontimonas sp. SYSU GA230001]|uniref:NRDE family protein n=1 Tax=Fontimonas sp. SYSU GA230001 TaxID=3142450 RepID=UPI0032B4F5E9
MCLIAVALDAHPRYPLVIAANRDEFHDRPAAAAQWWSTQPHVFGGRDQLQGGSWLAVARDGRWAVVTNVRRMVPPDPRAPSRGGLVADFLADRQPAADYVAQLQAVAPAYAGFNLLVGAATRAHYATNHPRFRSTALASGVHAVSNASLDTPWPKLNRLRAALTQWCERGHESFDALFAALADERPAADHELPDTGIGRDMERLLSPPFIRGARYGTRASTVLAMAAGGHARFVERRFGPGGVAAGETAQTLALDLPN